MRWSGRGLHLDLDHPRGHLDEAQTQRAELGDAKLERFGIAARRPHMSQQAPACRNSRN
ncbi:hypothetical protein X772_33750 [Mesorhizobium sp. LSJC280B00]|nr:hypothetical protein X772_33750 [Mesorhizobium sp. LSJC280B00]